MSNRAIIKRYYYNVGIKLASPLSIGSGLDNETDADVLISVDGSCYIPGTAIAGAFRNYEGNEKDKKSAYGFSKDEKGQMSSIFISDVYLNTGEDSVTIRDQVRLDTNKQVEAGCKFDYQIVEPGATGTMRFEIVEREGDQYDFRGILSKAIVAMNEGEIRLGSKKNRGMGRVEIIDVAEISFDANSRDEWIEFLAGDYSMPTSMSYQEWREGIEDLKKKYDKYMIPLTLTGGISIRRYSAVPRKADYEHITASGMPVVPGSSWNGAIRSSARALLYDLGMKAEVADEYIAKWFGAVNSQEKHGGIGQSKIVIGESVINGAVSVPTTRNSVNRFTAGTKTGALYSEIASYGGETVLEFMLSEDMDDELKEALQGLMFLVIRDIQEGIIAVGGQTAVGRGIFSGTVNDDMRRLEAGLGTLYEVVRRNAR